MDARAKILARRAHLLAIALAGCHDGTGARDTTTVTLPVLEAGSPTPIAHPDPVVPDAGAPARVYAVDESIPDGVSPETRKHYTDYFARAANLRTSIDAIDGKVAAAPHFAVATKAYWLDVVGQYGGANQSMSWIGFYCPSPARPETDAFIARVRAVNAELRARLDAARERAHRALGGGDTSLGEARWTQLEDDYNRANPRPCLSLACDRW